MVVDVEYDPSGRGLEHRLVTRDPEIRVLVADPNLQLQERYKEVFGLIVRVENMDFFQTYGKAVENLRFYSAYIIDPVLPATENYKSPYGMDLASRIKSKENDATNIWIVGEDENELDAAKVLGFTRLYLKKIQAANGHRTFDQFLSDMAAFLRGLKGN